MMEDLAGGHVACTGGGGMLMKYWLEKLKGKKIGKPVCRMKNIRVDLRETEYCRLDSHGSR